MLARRIIPDKKYAVRVHIVTDSLGYLKYIYIPMIAPRVPNILAGCLKSSYARTGFIKIGNNRERERERDLTDFVGMAKRTEWQKLDRWFFLLPTNSNPKYAGKKFVSIRSSWPIALRCVTQSYELDTRVHSALRVEQDSIERTRRSRVYRNGEAVRENKFYCDTCRPPWVTNSRHFVSAMGESSPPPPKPYFWLYTRGPYSIKVLHRI